MIKIRIMGKLKFFGLLLAAGMFAACSDNLENAGNENDGPKTGEGYVKVAINLPSVSSSRAFNDGTIGSLDDGTPDEYAVKDAILVFFKTTSTTGDGTPEATAQFAKAYNVSLNPAGEDVDHVTNRHTVIGEAPLPADGEKVYALAILNVNGVFTVDKANGVLKKNGNNVFESTKTLSALQTAIATTAAKCTTTGFMMLNAPLANTTTTSGFALSNVKTLVPVTVYESKNLAENGDVASIYVERVVAKVTLTGFTYADSKYTKTVTADSGDPFNGDKVEFEGWTLNYTNKTLKPVRDVDAITTWLGNDYGVVSRFLGDSKVDGKDLYRIYWAKDGNYDVSYGGTEGSDAKEAFNVFTKPEDITTWNTNTADNKTDSEDYALYCLENTMDYDKQVTNQTTSLILKTKYIANPDAAGTGDQNFFMYGTQEATYTQTQFLTNVGTALSLSGGTTASLKVGATGGTYTYIPSGATAGAGDYLNKKDVKNLIELSSSADLSDAQAQTLITKLGEIKFYKDGDSYYNVVLIRHFYDDETSWDAGETYGTKHLGRYGVVRNNWYEIKVNTISGPGEPTIDDDTENPNPDDEEEGYIKCQINVLSWARRSQSVDL